MSFKQLLKDGIWHVHKDLPRQKAFLWGVSTSQNARHMRVHGVSPWHVSCCGNGFSRCVSRRLSAKCLWHVLCNFGKQWYVRRTYLNRSYKISFPVSLKSESSLLCQPRSSTFARFRSEMAWSTGVEAQERKWARPFGAVALHCMAPRISRVRQVSQRFHYATSLQGARGDRRHQEKAPEVSFLLKLMI
jgi:hypothetical protein